MICKSFLETELTNWKRPLLCVFVLHSQNVLHRHPLYLIVRMLCYDDGLGAGKNLLALKTTDTEQEECSIWVYQCSSSVSTKWKVFTRSLCVSFPWCVTSAVCLNRSRRSPSAKCCRPPSTAFWHQTSPEAPSESWDESETSAKPATVRQPALLLAKMLHLCFLTLLRGHLKGRSDGA